MKQQQARSQSKHGMVLEHGASFEPDEHIATVVLRHVENVRDRLALESVSRVWRAVGQIPGVWQSQDLIISGDLAARLTDASFYQVLRRAGPNLLSLVVNAAPAAFTGEGLSSYAAFLYEARGAGGVEVAEGPGGLPSTHELALGQLNSLDLRRCPGVTGTAVLFLLCKLRTADAPKVERLQRLALSGCDVEKAGVGIENKHSSTYTQIRINLPSG